MELDIPTEINIDGLSNELLVLIFSSIITQSDFSRRNFSLLTNISHVCHRWRSVILDQTLPFMKKIDFITAAFTNIHFIPQRKEGKPFQHFHLLQTMKFMKHYLGARCEIYLDSSTSMRMEVDGEKNQLVPRALKEVSTLLHNSSILFQDTQTYTFSNTLNGPIQWPPILPEIEFKKILNDSPRGDTILSFLEVRLNDYVKGNQAALHNVVDEDAKFTENVSDEIQIPTQNTAIFIISDLTYSESEVSKVLKTIDKAAKGISVLNNLSLIFFHIPTLTGNNNLVPALRTSAKEHKIQSYVRVFAVESAKKEEMPPPSESLTKKRKRA